MKQETHLGLFGKLILKNLNCTLLIKFIKFYMTKVLITGGTGYIGGRLSEYLSRFDDCEIYVATRSKNFPKMSNIQFIHIDWNDNSSIEKSCDKIDTIIHLAGLNSADSNYDLDHAIKINVGNTKNLLNASKKKISEKIFLCFNNSCLWKYF